VAPEDLPRLYNIVEALSISTSEHSLRTHMAGTVIVYDIQDADLISIRLQFNLIKTPEISEKYITAIKLDTFGVGGKTYKAIK
jgi:hypothetical protein